MERVSTRWTVVREGLVAVGLIFAFFLGLLALLNAVFPSDAGLGDLIGGIRGGSAEGSPSTVQGSRLRSAGLGAPSAIATLASLHNDVKARSASSVAWGPARPGMPLHDRDAIQTLKRSGASVVFTDEGRLDLGPNTHIILNGGEGDIFAERAQSSLLMVDGEIHGRLARRGGKPVPFEVAVPGGVTRIEPDGSDPEVDFHIQVADDGRTAVAVEKGKARVVAGADTVTVNRAQFTTVGARQPPAPPRALERAVQPVGPPDGQVISYRSLSPRVTFNWKTDPRFSGYRLLVATDPDMRRVVFDQILDAPPLVHGNLRAGTYYWRVYGVRDGFEVTLRKTSRLVLSQTQNPPRLEAVFPARVVEKDWFILHGQTDPGTRVLVKGTEAAVDAEGRFSCRVDLDPGLNVVVVEAIDSLGNAAYKSQVVNSKH